MLLKKLIIENLRSYENQVIEFPKGSILLSGDIGSGKTTILLAIEFALFGLQPSQKANALLRNDKDNAKILLEFEVDGKNVIIERTLKRSKKSISQDYIALTIDNEKFEESITEIKSKILKLLNYPSEFAKKTNLLYKFTVYTPQEEMKQIILESKDVRLNTLRHVFGIDKYKRIQENTNLLTSKLREKIRVNEALVQGLEKIKEDLKDKENKLAELKEKEKISEEEHKKLLENRKLKEKEIKEIEIKINEKKYLENENEKSNLMLSEKKQQITNFMKNINSIKEQIKEDGKSSYNEKDYTLINEKINLQKNKENELQKEYIEVAGRLKSFESKKQELNSLIKKISGLEKCPTCLQEVSDQYKNNIFENANKEIQIIDKDNEDLDKKNNDLIEKINVVKKLIGDFINKKSELELLKFKLENLKEKEQRINEIESQKKTLEKDTEMLRQQILRIEKSMIEYDKYEKIFEEKVKELDEARNNENNAAIKKIGIIKEIGFLEQQIKEDKDKITEKENLKKQTEKIKSLEDWVSSKFLEIILFTEKQVMITLKHEFSNLFSKWFSMLVSDSLNARLDDEFSPLIEQQDYELDYSFLSGGERTAIALAYRLSLNQVINSFLSNINTSNIVILDEPTDGFSSQQLDKMREVLNELNTEQLILVSHEQKMEDFVENIIKIKKENGVSKIG